MNTTEPSVCGGDAALCHITLTICSLYYSFYLVFLLFHFFPFYQNRSTLFPGRRSWEVSEPGFSFLCVDFVLHVFLVKDACLFFVVFDLVLSVV